MDTETTTQPGGASRSRLKVSIASQYTHCRNSFHRLLQNPEISNNQAVNQTLLDEFGRFKAWAGNTGAHRTGKVSLDYRLREAPHIHAELVDLLRELNQDLEEAPKLIQVGKSIYVPHEADDFLPEQDQIALEEKKFMAEQGLECQEVELSELHYLVSDITHIITCFYNFSIAIRNPAPKERLHKIAQIDVSSFAHQDINHIEDKFRPVDPQNSFRVAKYLTKRLGKANTRRRQLLKYYKEHHDTISRHINDPLPSEGAVQSNELTNASKPVTSIAEGGNAGVLETASNIERADTVCITTKSQTTVSTVKAELVRTAENERDEDVLSQTSYTSSTNNMMRIRVPSPPNENAAFGGEPFECPYCFNIIKIRNRQDWKRHVFRDLQPYCCTFQDCPKGDELYSSQREWFDHEVQFHRREWYCDACSESFSQKIQFQEHIKMMHSHLETEGRFEAVISRCERAVVTDVVCPLCGVKLAIKALEKHLALHLQEVALFVLPHSDEKSSGGESEQEEDSSESSSKHLSKKSSFGFDPNTSQSAGDQLILLPAVIEEIKCICGYQHDDGFLVKCDKCKELQHGACMGTDESKVLPEVYECSTCNPGAHHLEIEAAINIQESFLKSSQSPLSTDPNNTITLSPDVVWAGALEITQKKLRDNNLSPLGITDLTTQSTEQTIEAVINALITLQNDDIKKRWRYTWRGRAVIVVQSLGKILKSIEKYSKVVDTVVDSNPQMRALVWAGIWGIMQVALNYSELVEGFEVVIAVLLEKMFICELFAGIYVDTFLELCAAVIVLAVKARAYYEARAIGKFAKTLKSFDIELQPFIQEINAKEGVIQEFVNDTTIERIRKIKEDLQDITSQLNATHIHEVTEEIHGQMKDNKMFELLRMLTPLDPLKRHQDVKLPRAETTGTWLLRLESFCEWRDSNTVEENGRVFCCYGIPGAGKTVICSVVIDNLYSQFHEHPNIGIACLYADYNDRIRQTLVHILGSFLRQFISTAIEPIPDEVIQKLQDIRRRGGKLSPEDILALLKIQLRQLKFAFICIDAVDELEPRVRYQLLDVLNTLGTNTRVFLTGRGHIESAIQNRLQVMQKYKVTISASRQDIQAFVKEQIMTDPYPDAMDQVLAEEIVDAIVSKSHGMFLLPTLHINMILEMQTNFQRRQVLETLPTDLYHSFLGVTTRIRKHYNAAHAELGMRVLMWLHFAYRSLKLGELQHALAVEMSYEEFDADNIPLVRVLLECCRGLAIVDEETLTVRFMHYTLEEYFRNNSRMEFPGGDSYIVETCLTYLNFGKLRQHCIDDESLTETMNRYAFLNYAALYWGTYVKQQPNDSLTNLIIMIVDHESERPSCAIQVLFKHLHPQRPISQKFSGIHATAYFGLTEIMAYFCRVRRDMELKDESGRTPLSWAAEYGHEAVVRLLIERDDVDINSKDNNKRTPLILAAGNGHEAVVQLLVERDDVNINSKDNNKRTPLILAAGNGHEVVVGLLIERDDVDINSKDKYGQTPLSLAARNGHEAVARLLIERDDIDFNSKDEDGETPLSLAAGNGHEAVVRLLIERDDVDINVKNKDGLTALSLAARNKHEAVVRLLNVPRDPDVA